MSGRKKGGKKQGQSSSSNKCNGHSDLYKRLSLRSAYFGPFDVPGFRLSGTTLLHLAAAEEDLALDIAQALLTCGCISINSQRLDDGWTPLCYASEYGQVNMVKLFLEQENIDVNKCSPLIIAASKGHTGVVKLLLACKDIEVNLAGDLKEFTPLHIAVKENNETLQTLLSFLTVDVNKHGYKGTTPLHCACALGHAGLVQLLVEHTDLDLNVQDGNGDTAIHIAAQKGHVEVVKILLCCVGIDINKSDSAGITPLNIAAYKGHVEVVKILLGCVRIDINKSSIKGATPLYIAASEGHVEVVKILLGCVGIDIRGHTTLGSCL